MNYKKAFRITLFLFVSSIILFIGFAIKMASKQVALSQKLSNTNTDLKIAISSFNNNQLSKDSIHKILREQNFIKRAYNKSDTINANNIRMIYRHDTIIRIEKIHS